MSTEQYQIIIFNNDWKHKNIATYINMKRKTKQEKVKKHNLFSVSQPYLPILTGYSIPNLNTVEFRYNAVLQVHGSDPRYILVEGYNAVFSFPSPSPPHLRMAFIRSRSSNYEYVYYIGYHILRICW